MATALNLTAPLKQDTETQQRLQRLAAIFADQIQPTIDTVLAKSDIVHFARILVIDNKYIQVLTEFDGNPEDYANFFRKELPEVFQEIFSLVENAPPWDELKDNPDKFIEFSRNLDLRSLGTSPGGEEDRGYLFSAFGDTTVRELKKLHNSQPAVSS
jgi:hypothetical protein